MKIENKIRAVAKRKTVVSVTRRARSKTGFSVIDPSGNAQSFPNKKTALANLHAQLRCAPIQCWQLFTL